MVTAAALHEHNRGRFSWAGLTAAVLLGIGGYAVNLLNLPLFFNVDFLFGSILSMFALLRYGPIAGCMAALIAALCTLTLWHHPWAIVIFSTEALFASWLIYRRRADLMTAVVLYWLTGGLLLVWFFYHQVMGFTNSATLLIALKQGINGIINSLVAETLFLLTCRLTGRKRELPSLRRWLQVILQGLVLLPAFVLAFADISWQFRQQRLRLQQDTLRMAEVGSVMLNHLLEHTHGGGRSGTGVDPDSTRLLRGIVNNRQVRLCLVDRERRILTCTDQTPSEPVPYLLPRGGRLVPVTDTVYQWIPDPQPGVGAMKRWQRSFYLTEAELAIPGGLRLVVEASLAPSLQVINNRTSILLGVLTLLTLLIIGLSRYFSSRLLVPFTELGLVTTQLPGKAAAGEQIEWRRAEVLEEQELQDNFREMQQALQQSFRELNSINENLEERVAARTAELHERERQLSHVLEVTGEGVWDWQVGDGVVRHNRRWCEILGIEDRYLEHPIDFFVERLHPDDREQVMAAVTATLRGGGSYHSTHRMLGAQGQIVWVEDRGDVMERGDDGKPRRIAGSINDITARKQAEAELEAQRQQLEELNRSLQQRVDEAVAELRDKDLVLIRQGRLAAMGEMIGNIAHQWRQPLNALSMLISNLQFAQRDKQLTDEYMENNVAIANRLIQKMSTTINDFRNFFSPDKEMVPFSALQQVQSTISLVDAAFKNHNIVVTVEDDTDLQLLGYPNEYSQVLLNLLNNAKDAFVERKTEGAITISLTANDDRGVVAVRDTGGGIAEEIRDKIFEPYFSTKPMGTGIGLYMSKMIIERNMHGSLTVQCSEGGSTFSIAVPLWKGPDHG